MDAWRSPRWILSSRAENQGSNLFAHRLPSAPLMHPGDEPPIQARPRTMPISHCSGCNQNQRLFPASPKPSQDYPEQLLQSTESAARSSCAQGQELLAEGQVFEDEILTRTEGTDNPADEVSEPRDHRQDPIGNPATSRLQLVHFPSALGFDEGQDQFFDPTRAGWGILACYENGTRRFCCFSVRGDSAEFGTWGHEFCVRCRSRILRDLNRNSAGAAKIRENAMRLPSPPKCTYCKTRFAVCRDHIVPQIHGGPDFEWNLTPACNECNGMLSSYLPAKDGDSVEQIRRKKALFLTSCRKALLRNREWNKLSIPRRWDFVRRGTWIRFLTPALQTRYQKCRETLGRLKWRKHPPVWELKR
jgi:hypothetical protein